MTLKSHSSRTQ